MRTESGSGLAAAPATGLVGALLPGFLTMEREGGSPLPESLVVENLGWLRGWLRGRVDDPEVADDLCQESFLRAIRSASELRDLARFPAWLYRIAENVLRDHFRKEARRQKRIQYTGEVEELDRPGPAPDDPARAEEAERLLGAIRALPARLRDPLLLRHSRGLAYAEIARILGISENAVQVRIFRARKRLREKLGNVSGPT